MVVVGDLIEQTGEELGHGSADVLKTLENMPWTIQDGSKIPVEIFSLYSTASGTVTINDVKSDLSVLGKVTQFRS